MAGSSTFEGIEMRKTAMVLAGIGITALLAGGVALADSEAIRAMAKITMGLNHFPSDDDKAALKTIIDSDESSEEEASIAMAISNMQHKITEADAERLQDILDDDMSDEAARKLAAVLLGINHSASDEDKATLATLAAM
jgi:hypothetical protein